MSKLILKVALLPKKENKINKYNEKIPIMDDIKILKILIKPDGINIKTTIAIKYNSKIYILIFHLNCL